MRTYANKSPKAKGVLATMHFNMDQIKEINSIAGTTGYQLMTLYTGIAQQTNPNMEDDHVAKLVNLATTTVRDTRLKLTKAKWFLRTTATIQGEKHIMYAVGKEAVSSCNNTFLLIGKP